mmetsp:Transcript_56118/g.114739  ORF Transcript_56118/g.114739 Transcript_56118/m.114739 type:complete len:110 (+) Transcript_56118:564-893(+)
MRASTCTLPCPAGNNQGPVLTCTLGGEKPPSFLPLEGARGCWGCARTRALPGRPWDDDAAAPRAEGCCCGGPVLRLRSLSVSLWVRGQIQVARLHAAHGRCAGSWACVC